MKTAKISKERMYQVIVAPVVTEKSTMGSENNQVTFTVRRDATKNEIGAAVEGLFDVKVSAVNTLRRPGKEKVFRGHKGRRAATKMAMVTLAEGNSIDVTAGI
jgi:large subunit ribosomal protein L23